MKKTIAKVVALSLIVGQIAFLGGCAKKCGEPVMHKHHKLEKMRHQAGGK